MNFPLKWRDLECGYGPCAVLKAGDYQVAHGSCIALLGSNGSGKSTLLKTISGTLRPLKGCVQIHGRSVWQMGAHLRARAIGFVPQSEATDFPFTVEEIVAMGRLPYATGQWESAEDHVKIHAALEQADCVGLAKRKVTELSGGELQRVLIARVLAQETSLILMDEPTSHLDVRHQHDVACLIRDLKSMGKLILVAVHDLNLATSFADRAILIHQRAILFEGPVEEVLASPTLDEAFQVRFARITVDGGLRVFAQPA